MEESQNNRSPEAGGEAAPAGSTHSPVGAPDAGAAGNPYLSDPDPDVRRAAEMLTKQRQRETPADVAKSGSASSKDVNPAVRLAQLDWMEKHDSISFEAFDGAEEREALIARMSEGPKAVTALADGDTVEVMKATEGGTELLDEWGEESGERLASVKDGTMGIIKDLGGLHSDAAMQFVSGFHQMLPGQARTAVMRELSATPPQDVEPVGPSHVDGYVRDNPVGQALVDEWGSEAPAKIARIRARASRLLGSMSPDDANATLAWIDTLTEDQARAIARQMAR